SGSRASDHPVARRSPQRRPIAQHKSSTLLEFGWARAHVGAGFLLAEGASAMRKTLLLIAPILLLAAACSSSSPGGFGDDSTLGGGGKSGNGGNGAGGDLGGGGGNGGGGGGGALPAECSASPAPAVFGNALCLCGDFKDIGNLLVKSGATGNLGSV